MKRWSFVVEEGGWRETMERVEEKDKRKEIMERKQELKKERRMEGK